jgi:hypothetical protein
MYGNVVVVNGNHIVSAGYADADSLRLNGSTVFAPTYNAGLSAWAGGNGDVGTFNVRGTLGVTEATTLNDNATITKNSGGVAGAFPLLTISDAYTAAGTASAGILLKRANAASTDYSVENFAGTFYVRSGLDLTDIGTGTALLTLSNTGNLTVTGTVAPGGNTVQGALGVAAVNDTVRWTAQTGSISAQNFANTTTGKLYRASIYANTTTAGSGGTVTVTISWNDGAAKTYTTATADLTATTNAGMVQDAVVIYIASGTPTWATTVAGAAGSPQYSVNVTLERLW